MNNLKIVIRIPGFWMKILEAILSITATFFVLHSFIETHSIHIYHLLQCTSFTYFLISATLITEYLTEETSHFTESLFLMVGIPLEYVSGSLNIYYYFKLLESNLLTEEFFISGFIFIATGTVMVVDLLCILLLKWPEDMEICSLASSAYLSKHYIRYWIDIKYHMFFISGTAGYLIITVVFILSYIQDRPNVLLENTTLLIMGIINTAFGFFACFTQPDFEDETELIPLGIMMIICGVVSLIDWLSQRFYGGWDRYYSPRRLPHRRHSIF